MDIRCPQCDAKFLVGDELAGKKAKCKRCGAVVAIPDRVSPPELPELPPALPPVAFDSQPLRHSGAARSKWRTILYGPRLTAVVAAVVVVVLGLLVWAMSDADSRNRASVADSHHKRSKTQAPSTDEPKKEREDETVTHVAPSENKTVAAETQSPEPDTKPASPPAEQRQAEPSRKEAAVPDGREGGLVGVSRQYDDMQCQQIQLRHGVRIPPFATILEIDGVRLPITHLAHLAKSPSPIVLLPRGNHAVRFRTTESPIEVTIRSDFGDEYAAMRKYFNVSGSVRGQELMNRSARAMDVHATPFLLNFMGAWHAGEKQWDVAEREFRRALSVNPAFSPAHLNLAERLLRRKALQEAAQEVRLADMFNIENVYGLSAAIAELRRKLEMPLIADEPVAGESVSYVSTETPTEEDARMTALFEGISKYAVKDSERAKILNNLAVHFADRGKPELALYHFRNALAVVRYSGPERFGLARKIFVNMSNVCRKAKFAEAEMYERMQNMISP